MTITFKQAAPADAEALTAVQRRTFDDDSRRHGHRPRGAGRASCPAPAGGRRRR